MVKQVDLPDIGIVKLYKRRNVRGLSISLRTADYVRVTLPKWLPYKAGVNFALLKKDWIIKNKRQRTVLKDGQQIGKRHRLLFITGPTDKPILARVSKNSIRISCPSNYDNLEPKVQEIARKACLRALKIEAQEFLPIRLRQIAMKSKLDFKSVSVKQLKSRWGSCSPSKEIVLSIFLTQLPWELIDYVILHELIHTQVLSHGPEFWEMFALHYPEPKKSSRLLKDYRPVL